MRGAGPAALGVAPFTVGRDPALRGRPVVLCPIRYDVFWEPKQEAEPIRANGSTRSPSAGGVNYP